MRCPEPKRCACGNALPPHGGGRGGRNRKHCLDCQPRVRAAAVQRSRTGGAGCAHCPHCAAQAARVLALEEVARELERQEWRAAAGAVRDMARRTLPETPPGMPA